MFVPSNVNVPVAEILWKFSVWWCFVFCQLHSVVSITSCLLHRNCPVETVKYFFIVETWLKGVGDEAKIADLTLSGYATRSFPQAKVVVLLSLPGPTYCRTLLLNPHLVLNIILLNCFQQTIIGKKVCQLFLSIQTST